MPPVARAAASIVTSLLLTLAVVLPSYDPPDVGGPSSTQGSGTRHTARPVLLNL